MRFVISLCALLTRKEAERGGREREGERARFAGKAASSSGSETITNCRNAYIRRWKCKWTAKIKVEFLETPRHLSPLHLYLCLCLLLILHSFSSLFVFKQWVSLIKFLPNESAWPGMLWGQVRNGRTINYVINNSDGHLSCYFMQIAHSA